MLGVSFKYCSNSKSYTFVALLFRLRFVWNTFAFTWQRLGSLFFTDFWAGFHTVSCFTESHSIMMNWPVNTSEIQKKGGKLYSFTDRVGNQPPKLYSQNRNYRILWIKWNYLNNWSFAKDSYNLLKFSRRLSKAAHTRHLCKIPNKPFEEFG